MLQVRDAEYGLKIERTIVNLRWIAALILIGQTVYLDKGTVSNLWHSGPSAFLVAYNLVFFLLVYRLRMTPCRLLVVALVSTLLDVAVISIFVADGDFLTDSYLGYAFLIIATALRFELLSAVAVGTLATLCFWAINTTDGSGLFRNDLEPLLGRSLFLLALSVGMGMLAHRLRQEREKREMMAGIAQQKASELEAVVESIADGVVISDSFGRILAINQAGKKLLTWEMADTPNQSPIGMLFPARDPAGEPVAAAKLPTSRAVQGETVKDEEVLIKGPDSRLNYLNISAAPVLNADGKISASVAVFRDITSSKLLQLAKDDIISQASHELRTPITSLKGYAQMMLKKLPATPETAYERRGLRIIHNEADRLTDLVNDLMDVSRAQAERLELQVQPFDLIAALRQITERLDVALEHHQLTLRANGRLKVNADRSRIERVFTNLISNAVKYSPGGGKIEVEVGFTGDETVVMVKDHGIGIPKNKQAKIFDQWYQAHGGSTVAQEGMGLGLYISSEIISRHGGRLWVESEEGHGSSFFFSLPLDSCQAPEKLNESA